MPEVKAELMLRYRINAAGEVTVTEKMTTDKEAKVADLFRYGMQLQMPASFSKLEYYGRGPEENYIDRHSSSFIGKYEANVRDEYYPYVRPQESGNHTDIRYFSIFNPTIGKYHLRGLCSYGVQCYPLSGRGFGCRYREGACLGTAQR